MERGETTVRKMALHVFFPVAASSALSVRPASNSPCLASGAPKGWRLVNFWSISADFSTLKNNCNRIHGILLRVVVKNVAAEVYSQISWINLELLELTLNVKGFELALKQQ